MAVLWVQPVGEAVRVNWVSGWKSRVGLSGPIKPTLIPACAGPALSPVPPLSAFLLSAPPPA
jgi:hypothetical protein